MPSPATAPSLFSTPLEELLKLSQTRLAEAAAEAGLTVEKMLELVKRAQKNYQAQTAAAANAAAAQASMHRQFWRVPFHIRTVLIGMKATASMLAEADRAEAQGFEFLETGRFEEASRTFCESQKVRIRHRFFEVCGDRTWYAAVDFVRDEKMREAGRSQNIPALAEAMREMFDAVRKELEVNRYRPDGGRLDVTGPGEVFSVNIALNFPAHPRPPRYNDQLSHY